MTSNQLIPSTYGSPAHLALRLACDELGASELRARLDRAAAEQPVGVSPTNAVFSLLQRCGLWVYEVDARNLRRALMPGQVIVGIGSDECVVVADCGERWVTATTISPVASKQKRTRREHLVIDNSACWLAVSSAGGLEDLARPGAGMAPWSRLRGLLRIERRDISVIAVYAATLGALSLVAPVATQALVNTIAFGAVLQPLIVLTLALFIGLGLAGSLSLIQAYVAEVLQRRIFVRLAQDFGHRLSRVADGARDRIDLVELNNRFFDVITVQKSAAELLLVGLGLILQICVGVILLGFYHPILLLFSIVLVAALGLVALQGRGGTESAMAESKSKFAIAAWLDEVARNPQLFATGHGRVLAEERLSTRLLDYVRARRLHFRRVFAVLAGGVSLQVVSIVALLGVGGFLVIERQLTLGQLVAAEIVLSAVGVGIGKFGRLSEKAFDLVAAMDKLGKILDLPLRTAGDATVGDDGGVVLRASGLIIGRGEGKFRTPPIDLRTPAASKVLLDGAPGSGKSTLLETLAGQREVIAGRLEWNGEREVFAPVVMLASERAIISGSIIDNLRLGDVEVATKQAWSALEEVGLAPAIAGLGGLDAPILNNGSPLSTSQCRRLVLARALVAQPGLLLIDGALDFVGADDAEQQALCQRFLADDTPWTALVVSNDTRVRSQLRRTISMPDAQVEGEV